VARDILGHANEAMTKHYSVVTTDEKRAAQASVLRMVTSPADRSGSKNREDLREPAPADDSQESNEESMNSDD
jgi:hypothetical protein